MSDFNEGLYFDELNNLNVDILLEGSYLDKDHKKLMIVASGYIDAFNATEFGKAIRKTFKLVNPTVVILNLQSVNYVASMGFGELVSLLKETKGLNIEFILYNVNPRVFDVLSLLGFSGFFRIIESLDQIEDESSVLFPLEIDCPHCNIKLKIPKSGSFKCKGCKSVVKINNEGRLIE